MEALGLAAAEDVRAEVALPGFDNSAMDGYAVAHADVADRRARDARCTCRWSARSGPARRRCSRCRRAPRCKIMTGAPVPAGADAVVPYEWTDRGVAAGRRSPGARARPAHPADGRGRRRGRPAGARPARCSAPASSGCSRRRAAPSVRVAPASAGGGACRPAPSSASRAPRSGRDSIYDGNSFLLAAAAAPGRRHRLPGRRSCPTSRARSSSSLNDQLVRADLVVTSGGVSMGDYDVVKEALSPLGTVWFGGVAMQPGQAAGVRHRR